MPELANAPLGLSILYLIRREESEAPAVARELVARVKKEIADASLRNDLIELIETVIIYKLAWFSREEIQAMLHVKDIRETRVYQEAMEEGKGKKLHGRLLTWQPSKCLRKKLLPWSKWTLNLFIRF